MGEGFEMGIDAILLKEGVGLACQIGIEFVIMGNGCRCANCINIPFCCSY
jgi:hypothetical protein